MSSPEPQQNSYNAAAAHYERQQQKESQAQAAQKIETIYTTVESEPDRTDWLTVVSNLRQSNRQLVEEIARLEQALASTTQSLHTRKEQNQSHEITILQQQDELRIAHDRLGGLFQQLETSHQIGQRQQTLIETLSQQLEIVQTIVPQIETEYNELSAKYQQQSQKLIKAEQVAIELHRRLQLQTTTGTEPIIEPDSIEPVITDILAPATINDRSIEPNQPDPPAASALTDDISESNISAEIDPAPPRSLLQTPPREIPPWIPSPPQAPAKTISSPSQSSSLRSWREEIANNNLHNLAHPKLDSLPTLTPPSEIADKESTPVNDSLPNWPAPTLNRDLTTAKITKIDLPQFPKKSG
jgi:hypothetical protein